MRAHNDRVASTGPRLLAYLVDFTVLLLVLTIFFSKKQTTKFLSANFKKNVKSKQYHIENSETRGQTV